MLPCISNLHNNKQFTRFRLYPVLLIYITTNNLPELDLPCISNLHNNKQFTRIRLYPVLLIYITINNLPDLDVTLY